MKFSTIIGAALVAMTQAGTHVQYVDPCTKDDDCATSGDKCCSATMVNKASALLCVPGSSTPKKVPAVGANTY